jgi:hypothetical protein
MRSLSFLPAGVLASKGLVSVELFSALPMLGKTMAALASAAF